MHTSESAAYGRDDDGAPQLRVCDSSRNLKLKESWRHVNGRILSSKAVLLPLPVVRLKSAGEQP